MKRKKDKKNMKPRKKGRRKTRKQEKKEGNKHTCIHKAHHLQLPTPSPPPQHNNENLKTQKKEKKKKENLTQRQGLIYHLRGDSHKIRNQGQPRRLPFLQSPRIFMRVSGPYIIRYWKPGHASWSHDNGDLSWRITASIAGSPELLSRPRVKRD